MEAEFTLKFNKETKEPYIAFKHHDKSNDTLQVLLEMFIQGAKERGIELSSFSSFIGIDTVGGRTSHTNYQIRLKDKQ